MRFSIHFVLLCAVVLILPAVSTAQVFPSKPLRIVVPFGAGGVVAGDMVAKADADGHTLLLISNATAVSAGLFKALPFDTLRDFAPVSTLGFFDLAIITPAESLFKSLGDLLAYAKAKPGRLNLATISIGSTQNLAAELFKSSAGVDIQIVPYNSSPAVITALRGRQVDAAVEILAPVLSQINSGALRALAIAGAARASVLPDVPTAKESGVTGDSLHRAGMAWLCPPIRPSRSLPD